jgi:hypothetical protein
VVNQHIDAKNAGHTYSISAAPWLTVFLGEQADLNLSAGYTLLYREGGWLSMPEIHRFSLQYRPYSSCVLEAGRHPYQDLRKAVASGLFDGLSLALDLSGSRFSVRALYTGLLYKESADILMTAADIAAYQKPLNYDDNGAFGDTYFASRRLIGVLGWELAGNNLALELIGQADMNRGEDLLHSAYVSARFGRALMDDLNLELGGTAALVKVSDKDAALGLSASGTLNWSPPGGLWDRLGLNVSYTSEESGTALTFFPAIRSSAPGFVLNSRSEGLAAVQGSYYARLYQTLWGELAAVYFLKTGENAGRGAFDAEAEDTDTPFFGGEIRASFIWTPFSDLSLNLDCGFFIPQWGNYFKSDAVVPWRVTTGIVFSF